jgi:C_GCAxxG_C_C family probable redox protein
MEYNNSESEADHQIAQARRLGRANMAKYACAEATLLAVTDTLNMPVSDDVFKAVIGLSSLSGGCGALCGAIAAIGLRFGRNRDEYHEDSESVLPAPWYLLLRQVVKQVRDQFDAEYGGYLCCDVQTKLFGRSFDSFESEDMEAFVQQNAVEICPQVAESAAGWAVQAIREAEAAQG